MPTTLADDNFLRIGWISLDLPATFSVHFDLSEAQSWRNTIYAIQIGNEVVRIGVAAVLVQRMLQWERDLSRALGGDFRTGGPNPWEVYEWRRRLTKHGRGEFWAQKGPSNRVLILRKERKLILKHEPCLCNDSPCGRKRPREARMVRDVAEAKAYWERLNSGGGQVIRDLMTP